MNPMMAMPNNQQTHDIKSATKQQEETKQKKDKKKKKKQESFEDQAMGFLKNVIENNLSGDGNQEPQIDSSDAFDSNNFAGGDVNNQLEVDGATDGGAVNVEELWEI